MTGGQAGEAGGVRHMLDHVLTKQVCSRVV